jgi:MFS family permease
MAISAIGTVFGPAKDASLPHLVPTEQLLIANSLSQSSFIIAITSGSALAGVLLGAFNTPAPAILFDAVSFFVSAAFIVALPIPHRAEWKPDQSARQVWHELKEGLHYLRHQRVLIGALVGFGVTMLGVGAINVLFVPFLVNDLHLPETYLGFIDLTQMVGMVFINLFIAAIARRFKPEHIIGGGIVGLGISLGVVGWAQTAWVLFPLSVAWGLFLAPVEATATMLMQYTPDHIRGRVLSTTATITGTANILSMALAGIAGAAIGPRTAFIGGGALGIVGGILAWLLMRGQSLRTKATIEQAVPATIDLPAEGD